MLRIGTTFLARGLLTAIGAAAGLALWALVRHQALMDLHPQGYLFSAALAAVFFGGTLVLKGPLPLWRAMLAALVLGLVVAGLLTWASLRFLHLPEFLASPERMAAALILATLPLPYAVAQARGNWLDYPTLFTQTWTLAMRVFGAWLFVALIWLVVWLSDTLLTLVKVMVLSQALETPGVPWALTGAILGLGLAVGNEFSDLVSPDLALRLLRLLVVPVLAVSVLFLLALPVHGLSTIYGGVSSTQTLLAMAVAAILLVSSAVGESDALTVRGKVMPRATQGLALVLPVLAALGAWGVALRVAQYGWTPPRIASALVAAAALSYGVIYAQAVLRGVGWAARIRRGNGTMALVVLAGVALTFTPALDAQRISATSQIVRYTGGALGVADLDLQAMQDDWGLAGAAALAQLTALSAQPGQEALKARLAAAAAADATEEASLASLRATLKARLPLVPPKPGTDALHLRDTLLYRAPPHELRLWLDACARSLPDGRPGCALVFGAYLPDRGGAQAILLYRAPTGALRSDAAALDPELGFQRLDTSELLPPGAAPQAADRLIAAALDGALDVAPARLNALSFGGDQIVIRPAP